MSAIPTPPLLTSEEYVARERASEIRHEYYRGEMFAMSGASREHNVINGNVFRVVSMQLLHGPCEPYSNDMRVKVSSTGLYTYPDIAIACAERLFEDAEVDTLLNPRVIVEVLSTTTEAYDRGDKFLLYRSLDSLREYILISQDAILVDHYLLQDGQWRLSSLTSLDDVLVLPSIDCHVPLREIYHRIDVPTLVEKVTLLQSKNPDLR